MKSALSMEVVIGIIVLVIVIIFSLIAFVKPIRERTLFLFSKISSLRSEAEKLDQRYVLNIEGTTIEELFRSKIPSTLDYILYPPTTKIMIDSTKYPDEISLKQVLGKIKLYCKYLKENNLLSDDLFFERDGTNCYSCNDEKWLNKHCDYSGKTPKYLLYIFSTRSGVYVGNFQKVS